MNRFDDVQLTELSEASTLWDPSHLIKRYPQYEVTEGLRCLLAHHMRPGEVLINLLNLQGVHPIFDKVP